jgi:hypothetical protein
MKKISFDCPEELIPFLDQINNQNRSNAILTILKSVKNGEEQTRRKRILDNTVMWACFGAIFLFISYILEPTPRYISIILGICLFTYGTVGGVLVAISRTKDNR